MGAVVDIRCDTGGADLLWLGEVALIAARTCLPAEVEISLVITDDTGIAALNERYLGQSGPTDVLAFPQLDLRPGDVVSDGALLGDVVVSLETAARQAARFADWSTDDELALLVIHGVLHLCGYDDLDAVPRAAMQSQEDLILARCGRRPAPRDET